MPSFALLPEEDLQAVIDYVLVLTHRGELEQMLLAESTERRRDRPGERTDVCQTDC